MLKLKTFLLDRLSAPQPTDIHFDGEALIEAFAGPAAIVTQDAQPVHGNAKAAEFLNNVATDRKSAQEFGLLVARCRLLEEGVCGRISVRPSDELTISHDAPKTSDFIHGIQSFDVHLTPLKDLGDQLLMTARECTAENNLASALSASRELYRDLVTCSADFAWETDARGAFLFVSKRGALGYDAQALNGRKALEFFSSPPGADLDEVEQHSSPFSTNKAVEDVEVWLNGKDDQPYCMLVSAVPVFDRKGHWRGARGVGRDITELRARESQIARNRRRQEAISEVVHAIHYALDPEQILNAAARSILSNTQAYRCYIYRSREDTFIAAPGFCVEAAFGHGSNDPQTMFTGTEVESLISHLQQASFENEELMTVLIGPWQFLIAFTYHGNVINGAIAISRPANHAPFSKETSDLLVAISEQVGIGIAQVNQTDALKKLSRQDPLTNLYNRRAFMEEADRSLHHHMRHKRQAALMYIDLDNFKQLNDQQGHIQGDAALTSVAQLLQSQVRKSDLVVRFGGDEFGIWLTESSEAEAKGKADTLIEMTKSGPDYYLSSLNLGMSVGIAIYDPNSKETIAGLIDRADRALYDAKSKGKNRADIAPPFEPEEVSKKVARC